MVRRRDYPTSKKSLHRQPDKSESTLIPWSLPHTGFAHNQWTGLYSRIIETGFTATIITTPALIGKQGQWLHPTQDRLITVREAARAQGFPDRYEFVGGAGHRYMQIGECAGSLVALLRAQAVLRTFARIATPAGNAVPPPLAKALAAEFARSVRHAFVARAAGGGEAAEASGDAGAGKPFAKAKRV